MKITPIKDLPSPSLAETLLYKEQKERKDAYLDWCANEINTALSKNSEPWLKHHVLTVVLTPEYHTEDFELETIPLLAGKMCSELYSEGYRANYYHNSFYPMRKFAIYITLSQNHLSIPKYVFEDKHNGWDKNKRMWADSFTGMICDTCEQHKIFNQRAIQTAYEAKEDAIRRHDNYDLEWTFDGHWHYKATRKVESVRLRFKSFWEVFK